MKKTLILSIALFFLSCEIEYDGETKLVVKGKVLLENNLPLSNHEVKLFVTRESSSIPFIFYVPSETNFVGKATTKENGDYTMVIPKPKSNYSEIIIEINSNSPYNNRQIRNIDSDDFENFELNIETEKLYQRENLANLYVDLNQVNANFEFLKINYIGDYTNEIKYFKPLSDQYIDYFDNLSKLVKKNQELVIQWEVRNSNTNVVSTFEELLIINEQESILFTINY